MHATLEKDILWLLNLFIEDAFLYHKFNTQHFISRPEMVQDVAFGTKTLKLDSGDSIIIPAVVRTMIPSRLIEQYQSYCAQNGFESAGQRSLYRVIDVCAA